MHHHQYSERQTSARLIIAPAVVLWLLLLQLLTLLPMKECVRVSEGGDGDPQLNAIYFSVLMSEGMDVNPRAELLQKALDGVQVYTEERGKLNAENEHQLVQVLSLIHQNLVKLPLSNKTRTEMYERLLQIIHPIMEIDSY